MSAISIPATLTLLGPDRVLSVTGPKAQLRERLLALEQADVIAEEYQKRHEQARNWMVLVLFLGIVGTILISNSGGYSPRQGTSTGFLACLAAAFVLMIGFAVAAARWSRQNIENGRYYLAYAVLNTLGVDIDDARPIALTVNFTETNSSAFRIQKGVALPPNARGAKRSMDVFLQPWFSVAGELKDDTKFRIQTTRILKSVTIKGWNGRGKYKVKTKEKTLDRVSIKLKFPTALPRLEESLARAGWKQDGPLYTHVEHEGHVIRASLAGSSTSVALIFKRKKTQYALDGKVEPPGDREILQLLVELHATLKAA